ncbi:MAG: hypothetical protein IPN18_10680 [Ignavibacteriales bacterium]|nr:hypothetical protein [Ignavibacteriales bacterium]
MPQTEELKRIIAHKTGLIELGRDDAKLHSYFLGRMKSFGFNSLHQYSELISGDSPGANAELKRIAIDFSNTESFFFRDHGQMRLLRETILPELVIKNRNTRTLNVLSAASSSGEELYSIAILLSEILPEYKTWKITLLGVDINHDAIKKAENGVYSKWSFPLGARGDHSKYFVRKNNDFMISESIKEMVLLDILIWLTIFQLFHLEEVNPPLISLFAVMFLSTLRVPVLKKQLPILLTF